MPSQLKLRHQRDIAREQREEAYRALLKLTVLVEKYVWDPDSPVLSDQICDDLRLGCMTAREALRLHSCSVPAGESSPLTRLAELATLGET